MISRFTALRASVALAAVAAPLVAATVGGCEPTFTPGNRARDAADGAADAVAETGADTGETRTRPSGTTTRTIFVGSDGTKAEIAVLRFGPDDAPLEGDGGADAEADAGADADAAGAPAYAVARAPLEDRASVPYASAGHLFVLEPTLNRVRELDPRDPSRTKLTARLGGDAGGAAGFDPRGVEVASGVAYVIGHGSNDIVTFDVTNGAPQSPIPLRDFMAPGDSDGHVDAVGAAYDERGQRLYVLLARQDTNAPAAPNGTRPCGAKPVLVAIDTRTRRAVDLSPDAGGFGLALLGDAPLTMARDAATGRLVVVSQGCRAATDAGDERRGFGVEAIDVNTQTSSWLLERPNAQRVDGLVWADAEHAFLRLDGAWRSWNPEIPEPNLEIPEFPVAPVYDGARSLHGLLPSQAVQGAEAPPSPSVVSFGIESLQRATLGGSPFREVTPDLAGHVRSARMP